MDGLLPFVDRQDVFGQINSSSMAFRNICATPLEILRSAENVHPEINVMFILRLVSSSLSIVATTSIIFASLLSGQLTDSDVHPIFMLSVADFFVAAMWLIGAAVAMQSPSHTGFCYFTGIITTCSVLVSYLLTASYANIAFLTARELYKNRGIPLPLQDKRKWFRYVWTIIVYIASWVTPFAVILPLMMGKVYYEPAVAECCSYCVADYSGLRAQFRNCTDRFDGPRFSYEFDITLAAAFITCFLLTAAAMLVWYFCFVVCVWKVSKIYDSEIGFDKKDKKNLLEVLVRITLFVVIFFVSAIPTLAASTIIWHEKEAINDYEQPDLNILLWQAIFAPLQGLLNSIVYGWTRRRFLRMSCGKSSAFQCCYRRRRRRHAGSQLIQSYGSLQSCLDDDGYANRSPAI